ncbi:hypothetical protein HK100_001295 [Physocladia obscura]|uniref:Holocytochrome c-type synthase n=1 Tax=Physocladia obscura TaxID=109957 RepID=A0AAD5SYS6_9FUNG|nr:hypothetical protein HK100_001295 [Physocladia obscura]
MAATSSSSLPPDHPPIPGMLDATSCPYHADNDPAVTMQLPSLPSDKNANADALNPLNNMPLTPNQIMAQDQKLPLSVGREVSSIPMAGKHDGKFWVYPSEQMFYNVSKQTSLTAVMTNMTRTNL